MRQRSFDLIRKPDLIDSSFLFNNVEVHYVATCPETNISFYANNGQGGVVGVRVYPDGRQAIVNATGCKSYGKHYAHGNDDYLKFKDVWGNHLGILASHAVYIAWRNKEIPAGMTIDHIDGCTTNNDIRNLRCVSSAINSRDGGFLRKLRKQGINPSEIRRPYLLRYFDRMAFIKENIPRLRYKHLDRGDLTAVLYQPAEGLSCYFATFNNIQIYFKL